MNNINKLVKLEDLYLNLYKLTHRVEEDNYISDPNFFSSDFYKKIFILKNHLNYLLDRTFKDDVKRINLYDHFYSITVEPYKDDKVKNNDANYYMNEIRNFNFGKIIDDLFKNTDYFDNAVGIIKEISQVLSE